MVRGPVSACPHGFVNPSVWTNFTVLRGVHAPASAFGRTLLLVCRRRAWHFVPDTRALHVRDGARRAPGANPPGRRIRDGRWRATRYEPGSTRRRARRRELPKKVNLDHQSAETQRQRRVPASRSGLTPPELNSVPVLHRSGPVPPTYQTVVFPCCYSAKPFWGFRPRSTLDTR